MDRKSKIIIIISLIGIIVASTCVMFFIVIPRRNIAQGETLQIDIYFRNSLLNTLEPETRKIPVGERPQMVREIINVLMEGPKNNSMTRSVPGDSALIEEINLQIDDKNTTRIVFSEKYNALTAAESLFCRSALIWTLTELSFIDGIRFYVGQEELVKSDGESLGILNRDNVVLNPTIPIEKTNIQKVILYFSDNKALGLKAEERYIEVNPDQSMERYIMLELFKGPESDSLLNLIPTETKLINNPSTEESICIVDLSKEFVDKHVGGSTAVKHTIYSIVNSLCELSNIKMVQFLIEGQKIQDYKGMMDLSKPLEPDLSIVLYEED